MNKEQLELAATNYQNSIAGSWVRNHAKIALHESFMAGANHVLKRAEALERALEFAVKHLRYSHRIKGQNDKYCGEIDGMHKALAAWRKG